MTKAVTNRNSDAVLGTCLVLFGFIAMYPMVEYNVDCPTISTDPDGHESCIKLKEHLWNAVSIISFGLDGDGATLSQSIDEQHSRNVVPIITAMLIIMFYQKSKT